MGWRVWGERIDTADFSGTPRVFQPVKPNDNIVLLAVRTWVIFYNNPTLTNLTMKIYSNSGGSPLKLLHSSTTTHTKAAMITLANGIKEVYFEFSNVPLKSTDTYHFALAGSGYTGTGTTHIAWMKGYPDPIYKTGITTSFEFLVRAPYQMSIVAAEL